VHLARQCEYRLAWTNEKDALVVKSGTLHGMSVVVAAFDFASGMPRCSIHYYNSIPADGRFAFA
jgi:hypothetical protein